VALLEIQSSNRASWRVGRRAGAVALVALFHAALLAMLVVAIRQPTATPVPQETIIAFPPAPKHAPRKLETDRAPITRPAPRAPAFWIPPDILRPATPDALNLPLTGCALENLASLPDDQRNRCANGPNLQAYSPAPGVVRDHAQQSQRWASALAKRHAPIRVNCTFIATGPGGYPGTTVSVPMADIACLMNLVREHHALVETYKTHPN
jgi:hypothetical protein